MPLAPAAVSEEGREEEQKERRNEGGRGGLGETSDRRLFSSEGKVADRGGREES